MFLLQRSIRRAAVHPDAPEAGGGAAAAAGRALAERRPRPYTARSAAVSTFTFYYCLNNQQNNY